MTNGRLKFDEAIDEDLDTRRHVGPPTKTAYSINILGEVYKVAAFGDGLGSFPQVHGQPRRFGVEIAKSW